MQSASSGSSSVAALVLDAAHERLRMRDRRRPRERRGRGHARGAAPRASARAPLRARTGTRCASRRASDPFDRLRVVRVAAERTADARQVEHQRRADQRRSRPRARARARARAPSPGPIGLEQRLGSRGPDRLGVGGGEQRGRRRRAAPSPRRSPQTTASASTSAGCTRIGLPACEPTSTRSGSSASWTATSPWKRSANPGVTRLSTSRRLGRRASPAATRIVCRSVGTPEPLELLERQRRSPPAAGRSQAPGSAAPAIRRRASLAPPRGTSDSSGGPREGSAARRGRPPRRPRSAGRGGEGGARTIASSGAEATTILDP